MDIPGFLYSFDPVNGDVQWRWNSTPRPGEPNADTWPNKDAMEHGGVMPWMSVLTRIEFELLGNGQSEPGLRRARPRGQQPVHLLNRGD